MFFGISRYPNKVLDRNFKTGVVTNFFSDGTCSVRFDNGSTKTVKMDELSPVITEIIKEDNMCDLHE